MNEVPPHRTIGEEPSHADGRLESWKEIAAYLNRGVRTVQRWERTEALPVCRHRHDKRGTVYAYRREIDAWLLHRRERRGATGDGRDPAWSGASFATAFRQLFSRYLRTHRTARLTALILLGIAAVVAWVKV